MIKVGETARLVRNHFGLSQKEAAKSLGISVVHLSNIENNLSAPSASLLDRYRDLWDVDLYVLAWCTFGNIDALPPAIRDAAGKLANAFREQLSGVGMTSTSKQGCGDVKNPKGESPRVAVGYSRN